MIFTIALLLFICVVLLGWSAFHLWEIRTQLGFLVPQVNLIVLKLHEPPSEEETLTRAMSAGLGRKLLRHQLAERLKREADHVEK